MTSKRAQTAAKRAREQAVKERRDLKRTKKAEAAAQRAAAQRATAISASAADESSPGSSQDNGGVAPAEAEAEAEAE
jgi:hypothetical protein